jgi:hypothetical protein
MRNERHKEGVLGASLLCHLTALHPSLPFPSLRLPAEMAAGWEDPVRRRSKLSKSKKRKEKRTEKKKMNKYPMLEIFSDLHDSAGLLLEHLAGFMTAT